MFPPPLGQVMDLAQQLTGPNQRQLARLSADAAQVTGADVRFVLVDALRSPEVTAPLAITPRAYATNLFNHWRVGSRGEKNNGVLVLLVKDARRVEVVVGSGLDATALNKNGWCAATLEREAVRRFTEA